MNTADSTSAVNFKQLWKARIEVVVSLPNFLCILISRSLSNLKLKYTTVSNITYSQLHRTFQSKQKYNGRRSGQRSTTKGDYYITHSMQYARSRWCTAYCTPLQQLRFWIHLMTVSMLNSEHCTISVFKTSRPTDFRNLWKHFHILKFMKSLRGGPFFAFSLPGVAARPPVPPSVTPLQSKSAAPPSHGLKQSQAFQDGIIS